MAKLKDKIVSKLKNKPEMSGLVEMTVSEDELRINKAGYKELNKKNTDLAKKLESLEGKLEVANAKLFDEGVSEDELRVNKLGYDNLSDKSTTMAHQIQDIETRLASLESQMISLSSRTERIDGRKYE